MMVRAARNLHFAGIWLCSLAIATVFASGCKQDWSERWGVRPLWRSVARPFEPFPLDRLTEELAANPPRLSFVVLGNTDLASNELSGGEVITTYDRIMADVRSMNPQPRFVFHMGDIADSPGDPEAWEELSRRSLPYEVAFTQGGIADARRKQCFLLPGDRDVDSKKTEGDFLERFFGSSGGIPFSFDYENLHFVALNSETIDDSWLMEYFGFNRLQNRIIGPQWTWLQEDLRKNQGKEIVVFIHKPLFPPAFSRHEGYCLDQYFAEREKLLGLLNRHSVRIIFAGHEAIFHWARIQDTYHITTGGAGRRPRAARWLGGFHHFLYVAIDEGCGMTVYCVDPERDTVEQRISVM